MREREALIPRHGGYRKLKSFRLAQLVYDVTVRFCDRYISPRSRTHDQMVQAARSGVQNIAEGSQASGTSKKMELKLTSVARASLEELRLDYEDFLRQRGLPIWPPNHPALVRFKARRCATVEDVRAWAVEERHRAGEENEKHRQTRTSTDEHGEKHRQTRTSTDEHGEKHRQTRTSTDEHGEKHRQTRTSTDEHGQMNIPSASSVSSGSVSSGSVSVRGGPRGGPGKSPSSSVLVANAALSLLNLSCYLLDRQLAAQAQAFEKNGGFTERLYRIRQQTRKTR